MAAVIERVDRLEVALTEFVTSVGIEFNKLYNSQMRTETEMRAFKEEMRAFKDEMRAFKDEMRNDHREMNRRWGAISNKLGTLVEDLVYPSLARIVRETFQEDVADLTIRHKRRLTDGRVQEFDAVAATPSLVVLNSTKSSLHSADVDAFVKEIAVFREFFPEYGNRPVVGILATLAVEQSVLNYAEKQGFLVSAVGDQLMELQNQPGFAPKRWP